MIAPFVKTGVITEAMNLWLAVPIGFIFGFALHHSGFTDGRKIARVFYFKDVDVPVVMFSAIVTAMLGLWTLSLAGFIDTEQFYFLPTYLAPVAVAGLLFGVGMVVGGYCPGTAAASIATGKIDPLVFIGGFFIGSLAFGDFFPVWGHFFHSDYRGVWRLDQLFGLELGMTVLLMVVIAIAGSMFLRLVQRIVWPGTFVPVKGVTLKVQSALVAIAVALAVVLSFFPTRSFLPAEGADPWYIVPKAANNTSGAEHEGVDTNGSP
jgi:hypothetical protein